MLFVIKPVLQDSSVERVKKQQSNERNKFLILNKQYKTEKNKAIFNENIINYNQSGIHSNMNLMVQPYFDLLSYTFAFSFNIPESIKF